VNIRHASGEAAGQDVFHFHAHVVPRWRGDDLPLMYFRWSAQRASDDQLDPLLALINSAR
jgi:histidine triad (HIT) family protein